MFPAAVGTGVGKGAGAGTVEGVEVAAGIVEFGVDIAVMVISGGLYFPAIRLRTTG